MRKRAVFAGQALSTDNARDAPGELCTPDAVTRLLSCEATFSAARSHPRLLKTNQIAGSIWRMRSSSTTDSMDGTPLMPACVKWQDVLFVPHARVPRWRYAVEASSRQVDVSLTQLSSPSSVSLTQSSSPSEKMLQLSPSLFSRPLASERPFLLDPVLTPFHSPQSLPAS